MQFMPLTCLLAGQTAQVEDVVGAAEFVHRLRELGFQPGAAIEMIQPGSPCIIRLRDQKLCFRQDELMNVLVRAGVTA